MGSHPDGQWPALVPDAWDEPPTAGHPLEGCLGAAIIIAVCFVFAAATVGGIGYALLRWWS